MEAGRQTYYRGSLRKGIEFIKVDIFELRFLVRFGFGGDLDLLSKYQQLDTDFEEMINRNMEHIDQWPDKLEYLRVDYDGKTIGFSVIDIHKAVLFSFGININYRKEDILKEWMIELKKVFNGVFYCCLWSKNKRAVEFLQKNGMKITKQEDFITYLIHL